METILIIVGLLVTVPVIIVSLLKIKREIQYKKFDKYMNKEK